MRTRHVPTPSWVSERPALPFPNYWALKQGLRFLICKIGIGNPQSVTGRVK